MEETNACGVAAVLEQELDRVKRRGFDGAGHWRVINQAAHIDVDTAGEEPFHQLVVLDVKSFRVSLALNLRLTEFVRIFSGSY